MKVICRSAIRVLPFSAEGDSVEQSFSIVPTTIQQTSSGWSLGKAGQQYVRIFFATIEPVNPFEKAEAVASGNLNALPSFM
jgi:hypothetical protein